MVSKKAKKIGPGIFLKHDLAKILRPFKFLFKYLGILYGQNIFFLLRFGLASGECN